MHDQHAPFSGLEVLAATDAGVVAWAPPTGQPRLVSDRYRHLSWSPCGTMLAATLAREPQVTRVYEDPVDWGAAGTYSARHRPACRPAWRGSDLTVVDRTSYGSVVVDHKTRWIATLPSPIVAHSWSDNDLLAAVIAYTDGYAIEVVDLDGQHLRSARIYNVGDVVSVSWRRDGKMIFVSFSNLTAFFWPVDGGVSNPARCAPTVCSPSAVSMAAKVWRRSSSVAVTVVGDGAPYPVATGMLSHLSWSPCGRYLALGIDESIVAYDSSSRTVIETTIDGVATSIACRVRPPPLPFSVVGIL